MAGEAAHAVCWRSATGPRRALGTKAALVATSPNLKIRTKKMPLRLPPPISNGLAENQNRRAAANWPWDDGVRFFLSGNLSPKAAVDRIWYPCFRVALSKRFLRGSMRGAKLVLLVVLTLLALLGAGFIVLANIGDASVVAATGGVYGALESAGAQDNVALRDDLYATVLRLREPWAAVNMSGVITLLLSVVALVIVSRNR